MENAPARSDPVGDASVAASATNVVVMVLALYRQSNNLIGSN